MKQSYRVLTAVLVALGLSACDSGAPTVEDAPAAAEAAASSTMETSEEATESAMGAIDDAADMLEDITTE